MHPQVYDFVKNSLAEIPVAGKRVLEIGSLDVNGSIRDLFCGCAYYLGIDLLPGPGVDIVSDASCVHGGASYDIVVCTEALEHSPYPGLVIHSAYESLKKDGVLILTCASIPRPAHAADGSSGGPHPGEYYRNIYPDEMADYFRLMPWQASILHDPVIGDLRVVAYKRG